MNNCFRKQRGFTLTEIMLVVALTSFIIAIAVPGFFRARELSRQRSCQENQQKIDGAKQQWAIDNRMGATATPDWSDLVGNTAYLRKTPVCTGGGTYTIGSLEENPSCSLSTLAPFPHEFDPNPPGTP